MNREQFLKVIFFLRYENITDTNITELLDKIFKDKITEEELCKLKKKFQEKYEFWNDKIPLEDIISPYIWLSLIMPMGEKNREVLLEYIEKIEL